VSHRFHRHRGLTAVILMVAGLVLVAAPVAVAQNAGDDQYADPFGSLPEDQGGGGEAGDGAPAQPQAAPDSSAAAPAAPSTDPANTAGTAQQLPRTGLPAGVPGAFGVALLGSGLLLAFLVGRPERLMAAVTGRPDSILHRAPPRPERGRRGRRR
jgi:hypothetical protein